MNVLFRECIEALGDESLVASEKETQEIINNIQKEFSFSSSGRLLKGGDEDCERGGVDMVLSMFDLDERVALFWDDARVPIVFTNLRRINDGLFDVLAVGFYTYIYSKECGFLVELTGSGSAVVCKK